MGQSVRARDRKRRMKSSMDFRCYTEIDEIIPTRVVLVRFCAGLK